jgi:hypothetical protein
MRLYNIPTDDLSLRGVSTIVLMSKVAGRMEGDMTRYYLDCSICGKTSLWQHYEKPPTHCLWCGAVFEKEVEQGVLLSPPTFGPTRYICPSCGAKVLTTPRARAMCVPCAMPMVRDLHGVFGDIPGSEELIADVRQFLKIGPER